MSNFDLKRFIVTGEITNISTASSVRIPINEEMEGEVLEVRTVLGGAIATANAVITVSKNAASMGVVTIATASSAEGDIDTLNPLKTDDDRHLVAGDYLKLATNGASTNTVPVGFTVLIKR